MSYDLRPSFTPAPTGTHRAVFTEFVDIGSQAGKYGTKRQARFGFVLPDEPMQDGRPYKVGRLMALTYGKRAAVRDLVNALAGRTLSDEEQERFDPRSLLGRTCMVTVEHGERDGTTYANIASFTALPKGMAAPQVDGIETTYFSLNAGEFNAQGFYELPSWLQRYIEASPEYVAATRTGEPSPQPVAPPSKQPAKPGRTEF